MAVHISIGISSNQSYQGYFQNQNACVADDMKLMELHLPTYMETNPLTLST